jgi:hypothetical protein
MGDQALIKRLKAENAKYAQLLKKAETHLSKAAQSISTLQRELGSANKILWAIANSRGGRVAIPKINMELAGSNQNTLEGVYDPTTQETIILASTKVEDKTIPKNRVIH